MSGIPVEVSHLRKEFGEREILRDVSFSINAGESLVILGESGMGKSVMLRIIGMLLDATDGSVKIDNEEIVGISDKKKEKVMKKVGFLFQYSGLFDHLSVWENIMFYELYIERKDRDEMRQIAQQWMKKLKIPMEAIDLKPAQISGGMQRRVAMARTIVKAPKLILLDEPTTGLDPIICDVINDLINDTQRLTGATMITITHDLNSALKIRDKFIVLRHGEILWAGEPKDLFNVKDEYIQKFIKAANVKV